MELPVNYILMHDFSQSKYLTNPIFCCSYVRQLREYRKSQSAYW